MKVVLLDRDGTVIVDPPDERVTNLEKIKLFTDTISALSTLAENDFSIIIVTNQASIAEGLLTEEEFWKLHQEVLKQLEPSGVKILKTYACLHGPNAGCECRKPKPTLLQQAATDFGFNLADVYMVGDRPSDVMAGKNAGAKTILVKTATNKQQDAPEADFQANSLTEAIEIIISS